MFSNNGKVPTSAYRGALILPTCVLLPPPSPSEMLPTTCVADYGSNLCRIVLYYTPCSVTMVKYLLQLTEVPLFCLHVSSSPPPPPSSEMLPTTCVADYGSNLCRIVLYYTPCSVTMVKYLLAAYRGAIILPTCVLLPPTPIF